MPINAPSPMEAFAMGQARGTANSPITGIGMAIQNIVDDARKKGLLKAQSQYQTEGSNQNEIFKENRETERGYLPKKTIFAGATEKEDRVFNEPANVDISQQPRPPVDAFQSLLDMKAKLDAAKNSGVDIFHTTPSTGNPVVNKGRYKIGEVITAADGKQYRVTGGDLNDPDVEPVTQE